MLTRVHRRALAAAIAFLLGWMSAQAQVEVKVAFDQERYLPHEKVFAAVDIANYAGRRLAFDPQDAWLRLSIQAHSGRIVRVKGPIIVSSPLTIEPFEVATLRFDIEPYFDLATLDRYRVRAEVYVKELRQAYKSPQEARFFIVNGVKIWERTFGVPASDPPEIRKYALLQYTRLDKIVLYFRLTDASENKTFQIFPFGSLVSFARPEPLIDRHGHLHVLNQFSAKSFGYTVMNPDGERTLHQTYLYHNDKRPRLVLDDQGECLVLGGVREPSKRDFPRSAAPKAPTTTPGD